jgi:hypothetical protein
MELILGQPLACASVVGVVIIWFAPKTRGKPLLE